MRGFRTNAAQIGMARLRFVASRFGAELRVARISAGLTQRQVASRAGVSQPMVAAAEAGDPGLSLAMRCRLAAATGHELALRLHPVSSIPLRDSGQLKVAQAIADDAADSWRSRFEVPTGPGPMQAADMLLEGVEEVVHVEIERALVDFQAQLRAAEIKRASLAARESRPVRLVIAMPATPAARRLIAQHAGVIKRALPVSSRSIWLAIRGGRPVGGDGLLLVR
ncbi:MAG TPA: helix-turn-helix domain-containing protein [Candidatus Limnocylindria bacterium]|nr:helix-turn-helix domain-containing protein [Candidatus Limnocylindria bacterium]